MSDISEVSVIKANIDNVIHNNNITTLSIFDNLTNDTYYVNKLNQVILKISTKNNFHFASLSNEIKLKKVICQLDNVPKILYSYVSDSYAVKVEEVIDGRTFVQNRDAFKMNNSIKKKRCDQSY